MIRGQREPAEGARRPPVSAWGWFFLGLFFGPLAAIGMLIANSRNGNPDR